MKSEGILLIDQHQERGIDQGQLLRKDQGREAGVAQYQNHSPVPDQHLL